MIETMNKEAQEDINHKIVDNIRVVCEAGEAAIKNSHEKAFGRQYSDIENSPTRSAQKGDFIKDLSVSERSLGYVTEDDKDSEMILVKFPKIGKSIWLLKKNYGQYLVV